MDVSWRYVAGGVGGTGRRAGVAWRPWRRRGERGRGCRTPGPARRLAPLWCPRSRSPGRGPDGPPLRRLPGRAPRCRRSRLQTVDISTRTGCSPSPARTNVRSDGSPGHQRSATDAQEAWEGELSGRRSVFPRAESPPWPLDSSSLPRSAQLQLESDPHGPPPVRLIGPGKRARRGRVAWFEGARGFGRSRGLWPRGPGRLRPVSGPGASRAISNPDEAWREGGAGSGSLGGLPRGAGVGQGQLVGGGLGPAKDVRPAMSGTVRSAAVARYVAGQPDEGIIGPPGSWPGG